MTPAVVSYTAAEHTGNATLLGYSDAVMLSCSSTPKPSPLR